MTALAIRANPDSGEISNYDGRPRSLRTTKNELGLDDNETRSWHGRHRHVSLIIPAFAMMASMRHSANMAVPPKGSRAKPCDASASPHDRLVDSGNPPYRHQNGPATHATRAYPRMAGKATSPSSCRTTSADESKNATAMLSRSHVGKRADDLLRVFACASILSNSRKSLHLDR